VDSVASTRPCDNRSHNGAFPTPVLSICATQQHMITTWSDAWCLGCCFCVPCAACAACHLHHAPLVSVLQLQWVRAPVAAPKLTPAHVCPSPLDRTGRTSTGEIPCDDTRVCVIGKTQVRVCGSTCPSTLLAPSGYKHTVCSAGVEACDVTGVASVSCVCAEDGASNGTATPKTVTPCLVGPWSEWGTCSAACGGGTHSRVRVLTQHPPASPSCVAPPALQQVSACNAHACGAPPVVVCSDCSHNTRGTCQNPDTRVCYELLAGSCPSGSSPCGTWHKGLDVVCVPCPSGHLSFHFLFSLHSASLYLCLSVPLSLYRSISTCPFLYLFLSLSSIYCLFARTRVCCAGCVHCCPEPG